MADGAIATEELRLHIEAIERLEEEKKGVADDIRDRYALAKSQGFDPKTMRAIVRLRKMNVNDRREAEAMLDTYKAALGMLDGTPLGRWALERLEKDDGKAPEPDKGDDDGGDAEGVDDNAPPPTPAEPEQSVDDAKAMGTAAAQEGKPVTANPFPARDIRRAAWDEAWCQALGSDGMDIPDALKPKPKAKKSKAADGTDDEGSPE